MKLGYRFYRESFIKVAILSVGCVGIFWNWFHGQSKDEPGAVLLIAILVVFGNVSLFLAMRRAKRREEGERLQASTGSIGAVGAISPIENAQSFEDAARKRKRMRIFMAFWAICGGTLFSVFGGSYLVDGIPVPWVGYFIILVGVLGLCGVNVFYGGPLDLRLDRGKDQPKTKGNIKK